MARILVVDDDTDIRNLVRTRLTMAGHQVLTAAGGPAALDALDGRSIPDLAVIDLTMPGMDGFELVERLREKPGLEYLPVIFLTGRVAEADVEHGLALGARYLTKPFMGGAFLHFVEMALLERAVISDW